jgi:TonB family protein
MNPQRLALSILICFVIKLSTISAQDQKKVTKNPYRDMTEQYYVLKENPKIKNGSYVLKINGIVYQEGFFKNNQRAGQWKIYKANNILDFIYDYDNRKIIFSNNDYYPNAQDSSNRASVYLGGLIFFLSSIGNSLEITDDTRNELVPNRNYKAIIQFNVDSTGSLSNYQILLSSNNKKLDQSALSAVKKASSYFPFLPAIKNGIPTDFKYIAPVNFSILSR